MDIETKILQSVKEECAKKEFPEKIIIDISGVLVFDENGSVISNPSLADLIENEYGQIITRMYYDDNDPKHYIKFIAELTDLRELKAEYAIKIMFITQLYQNVFNYLNGC